MARKDLVENNQKIDEANLSDELDDQMAKHFKCNHCAKEFETRSCLRDHRKVNHEDKFTSRILLDNLNKMESKVSHQKYNLLSCLLYLEKEDTKKHPCNCLGDCKINHTIRNWSKPKYTETLNKGRNVLGIKLECEIWKNNFGTFDKIADVECLSFFICYLFLCYLVAMKE